MKKKKLMPWIYTLPALLLIGIVVIFPIAFTGYISMTNMNLYHWTDYSFIGIENYKRALIKLEIGRASCRERVYVLV